MIIKKDGNIVYVGNFSDVNPEIIDSQSEIIADNDNELNMLIDAGIVSMTKPYALALIRNNHARMMAAAVGNASEIERDTWPVQLQVATAITANTATAAQTAMVAAMLVGDETPSTLAAKVIGKNYAMQALIGAAQGIKRRSEKAVEAATDAAGIDAALAAATAEAAVAMAHFVPA